MMKKKLERLASRFNNSLERGRDPVSFIYRYERAEDRELAGFISAVLAYGRVEIIMKSIDKVLHLLGRRLHDTIRSGNMKFEKIYSQFSHRLNKGTDIALLLYGLSDVLKVYGSLEGLFSDSLRSVDGNLKSALGLFIGTIRKAVLKEAVKRRLPLGYVMHLLPSPDGNSACKRLNLFLKWMLRKDEIDPGVWAERLPELKSRLVIPLDIHIGRNARKHRMTLRKSDDWKTACEITDFLRRFCPEDPLKYDFAICHEGMSALRHEGGERS
jgi:uncharacterized protein (TIGR02757 family)